MAGRAAAGLDARPAHTLAVAVATTATLLRAVSRRRPHSRHERFAALERLLAAPADTSSWGQTITALAWWPAEHDLADAVARVEAIAERWHWSQRRLTRACARELEAGRVGPHLRLLRDLDLNPLWRVRDRAGLLRAMIERGGLRQLCRFTLRYADGPRIVDALVDGPVVGLRDLSLGACGITPEAAERLAATPALAGLRRLSLHSNRIADAGALALVASPHLRGLEYLNLYSNRISTDALRALVDAPQWAGAQKILHAQHLHGW